MFRGIHAVNLDNKGRMAIPSRFRAILEKEARGEIVLTIDTEQRCLLLYPLPEWERIEKKLNELPSFNAAARRIQRLLLGHATELLLDDNGRILVPPLLRDYATLEKRMMLVGQGKKFEIWQDKLWESQRDNWLAAHLKEAEDLPEELRSLSL